MAASKILRMNSLRFSEWSLRVWRYNGPQARPRDFLSVCLDGNSPRPDVRRGRPRTQKKPGGSLLPARFFDAKAVRQSPITLRLRTDSVNPFRQQIYKSLVSVALKPHTAKPSARPRSAAPHRDAVSVAPTTCFWKFGPRAKQGMRPLLAHEVRPCSIYGVVVLEVGRRLVSRP